MLTAVHMGLGFPVTWLTLGLDHALWGMNPAGYHLTSLIFHATNAVLVYAVAGPSSSRSASPIRDDDRFPPSPRRCRRRAPLRAAPAARGIRGVGHRAPRCGERMLRPGLRPRLPDRGAARGAIGPGTRGGWLAASAGAFLLAAFAKSIVVGLPIFVLSGPTTFIRCDGSPRRTTSSPVLVEKLPFVAVAVAAAGGDDGDRASAGASSRPVEAASLPPRLALTGYGLAFYLGKTLWPWPLSPLYTLYHPVEPLTARYLVPGAVTAHAHRGPDCPAPPLAGRASRPGWPMSPCSFPRAGIFSDGAPNIAADRYSYLPLIRLGDRGGRGAALGVARLAAGRGD